jgi:hypothetical protein
MRGVRRQHLGLAAAAVLASLIGSPARADPLPSPNAHETHVLRQLYTSGLARMAQGDPAGALDVFTVTAEVASGLPQMQYSMAVAQILADWNQRERALPAIETALGADPGHPLYAAAQVLADGTLSRLGTDGALYLTPAGAERLQRAAQGLGGARSAVNGRYLGAVLGATESTGDSRLPARLAGFARLLGKDGRVRLPNWTEAQAFGRLFAVAVSDAQFQAYEPHMVARLRDGLGSLTPDSLRQRRLQHRLATMREQLSALALPPGARLD